MGTFLTIMIIVGCVGLILFVLVQNPKGGGLNSEFGSAVQLGGAKRATDILEKGTWGLAIGVALICLFLAKDVQVGPGVDEVESLETNPDAIQDPALNDNTASPFDVGNGGGGPINP